MATARTRTVPVEGAIAAFHPEVKLGPCTSVLRIVLHDIIINSVYIASLSEAERGIVKSGGALHLQ